jgi:hypothetical protein
MEAHKFRINPEYERLITEFKTEIRNLETILNEPENFIYEEINELKRHVDMDREKAKGEIDRIADENIQILETLEKQFKTEYKSKVNLKHFISVAETSKRQLNEYEKFLSLLSSNAKEREKQSKKSEIAVKFLQSKIRELRQNLFSYTYITYKPMKKNIKDIYGNLILMVKIVYTIYSLCFLFYSVYFYNNI